MFVTESVIAELTGKERYSAQARFLDARGYKYETRDDGSIALRQDELDAHTLSNPGKAKGKRDWRPSLTVLDKAG